MRRTAIFRSEVFQEHNPGEDHVESPSRLAAIYEALDRPGFGENFFYPGFEPAPAAILALNHTDRYLAKVAATAGRQYCSLDPDTWTSPGSYRAACLAAGATVRGVQMLMNGEADNAFALIRPPGHHAEKDRAMGFCLFNNIAVAAAYALQELRLKRVLIVDWDLHHGNGTQHAFYDTDRVLYFSTHQYPYYPGTGALLETGHGRGEGFTVNIPLPGGQTDRDFNRIFKEILSPIARQYRPDMIMVSAGFDIYKGDPLGTMAVTAAGFAAMTGIMLELADELCGGRLLLALEGGYSLEGLSQGVLSCLSVLHGVKGDDTGFAPETAETIRLDQARKVLQHYWAL